MTVVSIPIMEVDGVRSSKTLLAEHNNSNLQICSHEDQTLVTLDFLGKAVTVEARFLQSAIQDCSPSQWNDHATRSARL
jgi:hypothetical protein